MTKVIHSNSEYTQLVGHISMAYQQGQLKAVQAVNISLLETAAYCGI